MIALIVECHYQLDIMDPLSVGAARSSDSTANFNELLHDFVKMTNNYNSMDVFLTCATVTVKKEIHFDGTCKTKISFFLSFSLSFFFIKHKLDVNVWL